ncbi:MAG TPA: hypothetical protein VEA60_08385, partial [Allosphingosinicella sp.]|nr:hypothetical protein [Allosphingosinicella sp.]
MRRFYGTMAAALALGAAAPASADTVCEWMDLANRLGAAAQASPAGQTPEQMRAATRTALAMFEALNAIDRRYHSYLGFEAAGQGASQEAAAATAAYKVLVQHYPAQKTALDDSYALAMAGIPDERAREAGRALGEKAASAAAAKGGIDPSIPQEPYRPRTVPGEWIGASLPSLEPHWVAFRPWAIPSVEALRPPPPVALNSERW